MFGICIEESSWTATLPNYLVTFCLAHLCALGSSLLCCGTTLSQLGAELSEWNFASYQPSISYHIMVEGGILDIDITPSRVQPRSKLDFSLLRFLSVHWKQRPRYRILLTAPPPAVPIRAPHKSLMNVRYLAFYALF